MKELSIEEKAKAYDEAIERAKKQLDGAKVFDYEDEQIAHDIRTTTYDIFPELKESEDEKIRKEIVSAINIYCSEYSRGAKVREDMLAWLEKQGEIDKVSYEIAEKEKREFVGDGFIKCYSDFQDFKEVETYWLEYVGNDNYNVRSDNLLGKTYHITPCQLYTIFKKQTWLEKQGDEKAVNKIEPKFKVGDSIKTTNEEPLTITRITDSGYWSKDLYICSFENSTKWELVEQKPAWSEEDEKSLLELSQCCDLNKTQVQWLLSLKDRVQPQLKREWSKEDTEMFGSISSTLSMYMYNTDIPSDIREIHKKEYTWFNELYNRVFPQPKQGWSEENERIYKSIIYSFANNYPLTVQQQEFIKSLKGRYAWKPSDEQIKAVKEAACYSSVFSGKTIDNLISLSKQLKKLKGE